MNFETIFEVVFRCFEDLRNRQRNPSMTNLNCACEITQRLTVKFGNLV